MYVWAFTTELACTCIKELLCQGLNPGTYILRVGEASIQHQEEEVESFFPLSQAQGQSSKKISKQVV